MEKESLIGIDLGATNVRVARIHNNKIKQIEVEKIVNGTKPSGLLNQIDQLIQKVNKDNVASIGIGVPSVVDVKRGVVYDVQNIPSWNKVPVKKIFEKKFNRPVYVNNDANCFVLGEKFFGKAQGYHSIVGLIIGSGFGSGLILDNQLYSGENCGAGEVGMLPYKKSIFEHYCSGIFFECELDIPGKCVFEKMQNDEIDARITYNAFGTHLGNAIKALMYSYDPQLIILGGSIAKSYSLFKKGMCNAMKDFAYPNSLKSLKIEVSELEYVSVLGAAALPLLMNK